MSVYEDRDIDVSMIRRGPGKIVLDFPDSIIGDEMHDVAEDIAVWVSTVLQHAAYICQFPYDSAYGDGSLIGIGGFRLGRMDPGQLLHLSIPLESNARDAPSALEPYVLGALIFRPEKYPSRAYSRGDLFFMVQESIPDSEIYIRGANITLNGSVQTWQLLVPYYESILKRIRQ